MLSIQGVIDLLNDTRRQIGMLQLKWRNVYYDVSLHTTGAVPRYHDERNERWITPTNYFGQQYQRRFEEQLLNRFPTEPESTRNWRMSQYFPLTKSPFQQIMDITIASILQDSNYSIIVDNKNDREYIEGNNFEGKSLIRYFGSKFQSICEDPNGFFVYVPKYARVDNVDTIEPEIWFIYSKDILWYTKDELIFFRTGVDNYAWHVNSIGIFRYQKDEKTDKYANVDGKDGYYGHLFGYLPVSFAGGQNNTQGFLDSWLDKAIPVANLFIGGQSSSQLVDKEASHPIIQAVNQDCPDCDNHSGWRNERCLNWKADDTTHECEFCSRGWTKIKCQTCNGSGEAKFTPGKWIKTPKDLADKDMIRIHNFDTSINEYHQTNNDNVYKRIEAALYLYRSDKAESGEAKAIDQENKYDFISKISDDLFDRLIDDALRIITSYRNVVVSADGNIVPNPSTYSIIKPTQFQIKTADDLLEEYKTSTEASVPIFIRARQSIDYTDKQFGGDDVMKRTSQIIRQVDPIFVVSETDKQVMLMGGAISADEWRFSVKLPIIIDQIIREKGQEFILNSDIEIIKKEIDRIFLAMPKVIPPTPTVLPIAK